MESALESTEGGESSEGSEVDWSLCIICQANTSENLRCPKDRKNSDYISVYDTFLKNLREFRRLNAEPVPTKFEDNTLPTDLSDKNASWHHSCHQKFTKSRLERVIKKRKQETSNTETVRKSKRMSTEKPVDKCVFCLLHSNEALHLYSTVNADKNLRKMATELNDTDIIGRLSGGDCMALEIKYHLSCLTEYRNRYRSNIRKNANKGDSMYEKAKARAFVELVAYIEESIDEGVHMFKLKELRAIYENRIKELGQDIEQVNKAVFKELLLEYFEDFGVQEQIYEKHKIIVFPQGMKDMISEAFNKRNFHDDAIMLAKVAKLCRQELFESEITFNGSFEKNCQNILPVVQQLISMILYGPNIKGDLSTSQHCKTISQLLYHNCKKRTRSTTTSSRHSHDMEPPVPVYVGLNIHAACRDKNLIETLDKLGMSISYKRVLDIENMLAQNLCNHFTLNNIVCPASLRHGILTTGALDNIDHNPTSTTASDALHGTAISIIQHPTSNDEGVKQETTLKANLHSKEINLPENYTIVPATSLNHRSLVVPPVKVSHNSNNLEAAIEQENMWLSTAASLLKESVDKNSAISWSAYHAKQISAPLNPSAAIALLPIFLEKADSPAMVKHGMTLLKNITEFLNPGQIPIFACDCPIFAQAKYIQWRWPELLGEKHFVVMLGGLHTEKALWTCMGNLLSGSGWTNALIQSSIATPGTADSYLKVSHIMRTRHAHQVTLLAFNILQSEAFESANPDGLIFEKWYEKMLENSTFWFWDFILRMQKRILVFVRAHREKNLDLYIETLDELMFLFFSLDHPNYSRWGSIHIRDMMSLSDKAKNILIQSWVVQKTQHRFSAIPLDHAHEQENAKVKGKGGIIGLTEDNNALNKWTIIGPEKARILTEFEDFISNNTEKQDNRHHDEAKSIQVSFQNEINSLIKTIREYGNPFLDEGKEIIVLDTRDCIDDIATSSLKPIETIGKKQYLNYKDLLQNDGRSLHNPIKRNNLSLFKQTSRKKSINCKKIEGLKNNVDLFGRLYIANQQREGDPSIFFSHENQLYPPSLSDEGKMRSSKKSDVINCIHPVVLKQPTEEFECKIFDGAALIHMLKPNTAQTFEDYANKIFLPFIFRELDNFLRIDIVWDRYFEFSLKESTREKRGKGFRRKVSPQTLIPRNWYDFLRDAKNKTELFDFLTNKVYDQTFESGKEICMTYNKNIISNIQYSEPFPDSDFEEADTRIILHVIHAAKNKMRKIVIRTVDSDILILLLAHFEKFSIKFQSIEIILAFGVRKDYIAYNINETFNSLGSKVSLALPFFHAFSGCDTTSSFYRKGKKKVWETWKSFPDVSDVFKFIIENPFTLFDTDSWQFKLLERFAILLYDRTSTLHDINDTRRELFCKNNRNLENLPPTQNALQQHIKRCVYQCGIWTTASLCDIIIPSPASFGWQNENGEWLPVWMTISEAAKACLELIKCSCKNDCRRCKCFKANLPCTELCLCPCEK